MNVELDRKLLGIYNLLKMSEYRITHQRIPMKKGDTLLQCLINDGVLVVDEDSDDYLNLAPGLIISVNTDSGVVSLTGNIYSLTGEMSHIDLPCWTVEDFK